jgi:hypothetical protein
VRTRWWLSRNSLLDTLLRPDVLSGLMFMVVGGLGLFLARNLQGGTVMRMGEAYVPRLVSIALVVLGGAILIGGLAGRQRRIDAGGPISWRSLTLVPAAVFTFGFAIERFGLVIAILATVGVASLAAAGQRPLGVALSALFLVAMCTAIFVWGLGLPFSIWLPDR